MINNKVSLDDKLKLIYEFFKEVWGTGLIKDERSEPPTVEEMKVGDKSSKEVEVWWTRARDYFVSKGDESLKYIEGDWVDGDQWYEKEKEKWREEGRIWREANEKERRAKEALLPKEIFKEYTGHFHSYENNILKIIQNDAVIEFAPIHIPQIHKDQTMIVNTIQVESPNGELSPEKISSIFYKEDSFI